MENKALKIAELAARAINDKFGQDIMVLEVGSLTSIADYFVLCTANSGPHLRALTSEVEDRLRKEMKVRPQRIDGDVESAWITMDYASVLVHVMTPETRQKYQLESLWSDAPHIDAIRSAIDNMPLPVPAQ